VYAAAVGVVLVGLATAALVAAAVDGDTPERNAADARGTQPSSNASSAPDSETAAPPAPPPPPTPPPGPDGAALNEAGFARMQSGDFTGALPLLENSVAALSGSGELQEAWASYNLAFTRFALGDCAGVLGLLDRSEAVQGERRDIDRLRRDAERSCDGEGRSGKKDKGSGKDDDD
jgi:hypothetical protein